MSKYHVNCTKDATKQQKCHSSKSRPPAKPAKLTTKPFCDCKLCACDDCPDILKKLGITVTDTSCDFDLKVTKDKKQETCTGHDLDQHQSFLDLLNQDKDCSCDIMARAVRSNINENMGLTARRAEINSDKKPTTSQNTTRQEPDK